LPFGIFYFQMMAGDEFEHHETNPEADSEAGVEEPEVPRGPFLEATADRADHDVRGEVDQASTPFVGRRRIGA
jgi:hypothetical protein